ncbi:hypothetical protein ACIHEI_07345 [Kitasatospora sp. NPDC051984]|uniref:hypothetical protein n=1 Tax=Kitasatospora sp. NPDC051984 TaxID=3364059 RepID=UPI0037C6611E
MSFQPSSIPYFDADPAIGTFFRYALSPEFIDDVHETRVSTERRNSAFSRHLREALENLLRERPCDVIDWARLTKVAFNDEAHLYGYLQDLFDHLFEGRSEPPVAPDPEAPMPDWVDMLWS